MARERNEKLQNSMPVGKVARTTVAGVTAARIGAKKLGLMSKRPFLSQESFNRHKKRNEDETAVLLFAGLSRLRGSALKIAQIMSLELGILPEAYRRELYKSHYQVPPLNRALIRKIMMSEFGKPPEEIFAHFEPDAFAAASLGQVHKAIAKTGDRLAVKVQYPGVGGAMKNDLQMIRQLMLPFYRTEYVSDILSEVENRLIEEIDYERESNNTKWFGKHARMPGVTVPQVRDEFTGTTVITTELLDGHHIDQWLLTKPPQLARDRAAQLIYDYFMYCSFQFHKMHADPNPGNYLFHSDGTIAVIDFGAVKTFNGDFCNRLTEIWRAHLREDLSTVVQMYSSFGFAKGNRQEAESAYEKVLKPFGDWLRYPYQFEVFDFGENSDFCARGIKLVHNVLGLREMDGFTTETVMFDRNFYGLFRIFTELKARVRLKNEWLY